MSARFNYFSLSTKSGTNLVSFFSLNLIFVAGCKKKLKILRSQLNRVKCQFQTLNHFEISTCDLKVNFKYFNNHFGQIENGPLVEEKNLNIY